MTQPNGPTRRSFLTDSAKLMALGGLVSAGCNMMNGGADRGPTLGTVAGPKPPSIDPNQTIRIGLIGVGSRMRALIHRSVDLPNLEFVAMADPNKENTDKMAKMIAERVNQTPEVYHGEEDYRKILERDDIDAVMLATPCYLHAKMYVECFAAGKHFYGEKPMAITVNGADAVVEAQRKNPDVKCQIGFQRRANPYYQQAIQQVHDGALGELFDGRGAWLNAWGPLGKPGTPSEWFGRRAQSGDWMLEQACHTWDAFNWICNSPAIAATGIGRRDLFREMDPDRDVTDFYFAHIEYPNGLVLDFEHSWICPHKDDGKFSGVFERAGGTKAGLSLGLYPPDATFYYRDNEKEPTKLWTEPLDATAASTAAFFDALRHDKTPVSGVDNGRIATLVGLMVRKAVDEKRRVTMKEITG